jgi:signal transduction histidine kinase
MRDHSKGLNETLQDTVDAARDLCATDCAGITRVERLPNGTESMRWIAANGPLRAVLGQLMCLDRNLRSVLKEQKPRLVFRPHRLFPQIAESWNIAEALLVPWSSDRSKGILWVVKRFESKSLDADDIRMLINLAAFASFAIANDEVEASRLDEERVDAAAKVAHELAHAVNNPLQALTNALYLMDTGPGDHLQDAQTQLQRINALVRVILDENARPFKN